MEPSYIELKLISCKDIKAFNFFQKLTVYALVSIASNDPTKQLTKKQKQQQRTPTDRDSDDDGSNPEWNHETRFDLGFLSHRSDPNDLFFHFVFRHDGVILGDKMLGECRVAFSDLVRDVEGVARFVSYEIRSAEGKPNGIFNFSYRLKGIGNQYHSSQILEGRISGYPVLAPEDCNPVQSPVQYSIPTPEIEKPCYYPPVCSVEAGSIYPPVAVAPPPPPPSVSYPPNGEYHYYYPPPPQPYPPPPPVAQVYPPIGPAAHHWPSGPYFERRW